MAVPKDVIDATKIAQDALVENQLWYADQVATVFESAATKFKPTDFIQAAKKAAAGAQADIDLFAKMQSEVVAIAEKRYDAEISAEKKMMSRFSDRQKTGADMEIEGLGQSNWQKDFSGESQGEMMSGKLDWGDIEKEAIKPLSAVHALTKEIQEALVEGRSETVFELAGNEEMKSLTREAMQWKSVTDDIRGGLGGVNAALQGAKTKQEMLTAISQEALKIQAADQTAEKNVEIARKKLQVMQEAFEMSKLELATLPIGTVEYEKQREKLLGMNDALHVQKNVTVDIESFRLANKNLLEEQLPQMMANVAGAKDSADAWQTNILFLTDANKELKQQSKLLDNANDILVGYGDNMKKFMDQWGGAHDHAIDMIDSASSSIDSWISQIPGIGGMLSKHLSKPMADATKTAKEAVSSFITTAADVSKKTKSSTQGLAAGWDAFTSKIKSGNIGKFITAAFNPAVLLIGAIVALLAMAIKQALELDQAAYEFRQEMGLSHTATQDIHKNAKEIRSEFAGMGVTLEGAYSASKALTEQFGSTMMVSKETTAAVAMMSRSMGVAEASAAGAIDKFMQIGAGSEKAAVNLTLATSELAAAAGIPLDAVLQDVANAGESALLAFSGNPKALAAAAVEARRLGTTIDAITGSMDKMLDFESSMNAEMKLSSMMGRHISMDKARQLAAQGDAVGLAEEQHRLLQQMGGLENMNRFQQKAAAEALGMSVEEMFKMNNQKEMEATLGAGELKAHQEKLRALKGEADLENMTAAQKMRHRMAEELKEAKMEAAKARLNELMIELGEKLLPMVQTAMKAIVPIAEALAFAAELVFMPFTLLSDLISGDLGKNFDTMGGTLKAIGGMVVGYIVFIRKDLFGMWGMIKKMGSSFASMFEKGMNPAKKLWEVTKKIWEKKGDGGAGGDVAGDVQDDLIDEGKEKAKGVGGWIKEKIFGKKDEAEENQEQVSQSDAAAADQAGGGPADQSEGMIEKFNRIDMKQILKAAAALLIIAAALWVAAKAFQEFADVEWEAVAKGTVGLAAMVGALVIMAKVLKNNQADLIKGAAALVIIAGAMLVSAFAFQQFGAVPWTAVVSGSIALATMVGGLYALSTFVEGKEKTLLKGIGLLALMGVALIPASFAFQQFAKVPWQAVIAGSVALGVMSTSLVYMSKAMDGVKWSSVFKGAAGIALLGVAMIPASYAFGLFGAVPWQGVFLGITALAALALTAGIIGQFISQIVQGALAIALLGLAMIPAAFAFKMFSDIDWAGVFIGIGALSLLALVAGILGAPPIIGFVLLGALAIAALGVALIPFAVAAIMAGYAMGLVADAFVTMTGALSELTWEQIGMIFGLGAAFAFMGMLLPFIFLGAIALGVISIALMGFGMAAELIAPGIALLADGFDRMVESLSKITFEMVGVVFALGLAFAAMGLLFPLIVLGAAALGVMSLAMMLFGFAAQVAGPGIDLLVTAFDKLADVMTKIVEMGIPMFIVKMGLAFALMGILAVPIIAGAVAMGFMAEALFVFGIAALIAAPGIYLLGLALDVVAESLSKLTLESVVALTALGLAVAGMGALFVPIILGSIAIGVMSIALLAFGKAAEFAAPGIEAISSAFSTLIDSLSKVTLEMVGTLALLAGTFIMMGVFAIPILIGAFAMGVMAGALLLMGFAAEYSAGPLMMLGFAMEMMGESLSKISMESVLALGALGLTIAGFALLILPMMVGAFVASIMAGAIFTIGAAASFAAQPIAELSTTLNPLIDQMVRIAEVAGSLWAAAGAIAAVGAALAIFGATSAIGSVVSSVGSAVSGAIDTVAGWFGGGKDEKEEKAKKDPLEQMIRLGEHGADLAKAADAITAVNDIKFDGAGLRSMADGMSAMAWAMMDMTSGGVWSWFGVDEKSPLETMAEGMGTIADAAKQMEPGVTGLVNVFSGLQAMASETFADGMDAATDAIYRFVAALSTIPDDKIEVVGQFASAGTEQSVEAQGSGPAGMPIEEMGGTEVLGETTELAATIGSQPSGPAAGGGADIDVSGLAQGSQLAQLITLMKSGGIAVYLDSKKVSKQLAAASED